MEAATTFSMIKRVQYALEFLTELQADGNLNPAYTICAREEDIPEHHLGLEVSLVTVKDWLEETLADFQQCLTTATDKSKTAVESLVEIVELIRE
jgi:hypothetical protein